MTTDTLGDHGAQRVAGALEPAGRGRRILLVNHWHDDNKGDSAITIATIGLLTARWPDAELTLVSMLGTQDPALGRAFRHVSAAAPAVHTRASFLAALSSAGRVPSVRQLAGWVARVSAAGIETALGRPPRDLAEAVAAADLLVMIGGSNVFDTGRRPPVGTLRLLQNLLPALAAKRSGTAYVLLGHTLGPVNTRVGRALLRSVVRNAELTVVREAHSADFVRNVLGLELGDRLRTAPDVAFAIDPTPTPRLDALLAERRATRFAVLVPRSYHHPDAARDDRLVAELTALGRIALDTGVVNEILVFPQCLGPTIIEDDRITARRIAAADQRFQLVDVDLSPGEIAELFRHATFVVGVRLHALILACTVGTAVHGIEYFTTKTRGVFESMGLAGHWSEFDSFDAAAAMVKIRELLEPEQLALVQRRADEMRVRLGDLELAALVS